MDYFPDFLIGHSGLLGGLCCALGVLLRDKSTIWYHAGNLLHLLVNFGQDDHFQLIVNDFHILLHERLNSLLHLFLDNLWQGSLHSLGDGLLDLNLQVFLSFDLLLKGVHLHVKLSELAVQLLIVLNDLCLLGLPGGRDDLLSLALTSRSLVSLGFGCL